MGAPQEAGTVVFLDLDADSKVWRLWEVARLHACDVGSFRCGVSSWGTECSLPFCSLQGGYTDRKETVSDMVCLDFMSDVTRHFMMSL